MRLPVAEGDKPRSRAAANSGGVRRRLRVLVVDDNKDAADSLAILLQAEGPRYADAYSSEAGN